MKRKSIFATLACLSLVVALCFCLVACGPSATAASGVNGEKVTEEKWNAMFDEANKDFDNLKIEIVSVQSGEDTFGSFTRTEEVTITKVGMEFYSEVKTTYAGDKELLALMGAINSTEVYYYAYDSDAGKEYKLSFEGKWVSDSSAMTYTLNMLGSIMPGSDFNDYEYNDEYKGYVVKDSVVKSDYAGIKAESAEVFKFDSNGRLVAVWQINSQKSAAGDYEKSTMSVTATYGGQKLPAKPSEDELENA